MRDRYGYDNRLQTWRNRLGDLTSNAVVFVAEQRGAGSSLLRQAVAYLKAGGSDHVTLWCSAANGRAGEFYRKFGFVLDGSEVTRPSGVKELRWRMPMW